MFYSRLRWQNSFGLIYQRQLMIGQKIDLCPHPHCPLIHCSMEKRHLANRIMSEISKSNLLTLHISKVRSRDKQLAQGHNMSWLIIEHTLWKCLKCLRHKVITICWLRDTNMTMQNLKLIFTEIAFYHC